jgi:hypothetical protein
MRPVDGYGAELAEGIEAALGRWVQRCVRDVMVAWQGDLPSDVATAAAEAGRVAAAEVGEQVRALLDADIDAQRTTPLQLVRAAVRYPTAVLAAAGAPPVELDDFTSSAFPADVYGLSPASWAEVDPALVDASIAWGASKAFAHKQRHAPRP